MPNTLQVTKTPPHRRPRRARDFKPIPVEISFGDAPFSESEILARLHDHVEDLGDQRSAAEDLGLSQQYLSDILLGKRGVSDTVAQKLGFRRIVAYACREDAQDA